MSDQEKYSLKEIIGTLSDDIKAFKIEVKADIKDLSNKFSSYKTSNDSRISLLESEQKVTAKTIAIYLSFGATFVMMVVQTYMSFVK